MTDKLAPIAQRPRPTNRPSNAPPTPPAETPKPKPRKGSGNSRKTSPAYATRRHAALLEMYLRHYPDLIAAAGENAYINALDIEAIVGGLANQFDSYHGPATGKHADAAFLRWALKGVRTARDMMPLARDTAAAFMVMWSKCGERSAEDGIRSVLNTCRDLREHDSADELLRNVCLWALCNADSLLDPNEKATPSTRLRKRGRWAARAEKTTRLRNREKFGGNKDWVDIELIGVADTGEILVEPALYADVPAYAHAA
jgi:hypothetical protein